jgi:hypothetical protein
MSGTARRIAIEKLDPDLRRELLAVSRKAGR